MLTRLTIAIRKANNKTEKIIAKALPFIIIVAVVLSIFNVGSQGAFAVFFATVLLTLLGIFLIYLPLLFLLAVVALPASLLNVYHLVSREQTTGWRKTILLPINVLITILGMAAFIILYMLFLSPLTFEIGGGFAPGSILTASLMHRDVWPLFFLVLGIGIALLILLFGIAKLKKIILK